VVGAGDPTSVGGRFTEFMNLAINSQGEMAFEGRVHGGSSTSGIFVGSKSGVRKVAVVGDPSPVGGTFNHLALPLLNDHGDVLFWASLEGGEVPAGLFLASGGTIKKVVARGEVWIGETAASEAMAKESDDARTIAKLLEEGHIRENAVKEKVRSLMREFRLAASEAETIVLALCLAQP